MRKFILSVIVLMEAVSASATGAVQAQDNLPSETITVNADSAHTTFDVDSIRTKSVRLGKRIAESALVAADSIKAFGARMGEKAHPLADTIVERSRQAWRVIKGDEPMPENSKKKK